MNDTPQEHPVTVSAFRPGDWFGIVGPAVSVFLPPSEKARVGTLWALVDDGADFDEVLDSLIASGLRSLPAFLLLGSADPTRVVARGAARAVFELSSGDQVIVDGADAGTWTERTVAQVARVSVVLEEDAGAAGERSVETGLVRVGRLDRPPVEPETETPPPAPIAAASEAPAAALQEEQPAAQATDAQGLAGTPSAVAAAFPTPTSDPLTDPLSSLGVDGPPAEAPSWSATEQSDPEQSDAEPAGTQEPEAVESTEPVTDDEAAAAQGVTADVVPSWPVGEPGSAAGVEPEAVSEPAAVDPAGVVPSWPPLAEEPETAAEAAQPAGDLPAWPAPDAQAAPAAPEEQSVAGAAETPSWPTPASASLADGAPEPSLEPPLSIGSWKRDDDPLTGEIALDDGAETEVFDVQAIADAGAQAPDTPAPWPAPPAPATEEPSGWQAPAWGAPEAAQTPEHDGQTVSGGWDAGEFARQQPGIPGQTPAPDVTAQPVATLVFAHGEVVAVDRAVLVGRAPEARRFTTTDQPRLVTVPSPNHEISSTHLEVRPGSGADHGSAVVTDMGSTNGTVLVQPGLGPESLTPGMPVQLLPGALIDLGDGMTIQVAGA